MTDMALFAVFCVWDFWGFGIFFCIAGSSFDIMTLMISLGF